MNERRRSDRGLTHSGESWLPTAFIPIGQTLCVEWLEFGAKKLTEPFFGQTVDMLRRKRSVRITDLSVLFELSNILPAAKPSGIILHATRCGSTLLTNVMRTCRDVTALSEAAPIEFILGLDPLRHSILDDADKIVARSRLLTCVIKHYVHLSGPQQQNLIIKCYPASNLQIELIRALWPDVPLVFVIRDPLEIVLSNFMKPAAWVSSNYARLRDAMLYKLDPSEIEGMSSEEFCAHAIGSFYEAALARADMISAVVDYDQMNIETFQKIASLFGLTMPAPESDAINQALRSYSKDPSGTKIFENDTETKRSSASESLIQLTELLARPAYLALRSRCVGEGVGASPKKLEYKGTPK